MFRSTLPALLLLSTAVNAAELTIEVTDLRNDRGHILLVVDNNADDFEASLANVAGIKLKASKKDVKITLYDFPEGRYAVSVIHDENDNERLDMKGQSPSEGYGFSGVGGAYKLPTFQKAAVEVSGSSSKITIKTTYLD